MNRKLKSSLISLFFLFAVASAVAVPQPPHEVYGTLTDSGEQVEGVEVYAISADEVIVTDTTSSDGYYELKVPSKEYSSFDIVVNGSVHESGISVESSAIEEYSFSGSYSEDTEEKSGDSSGDGAPVQAPGPRQIEASPVNGSSRAVIENVQQNQDVQVTVPETPDDGSNPVEQISFTSSTSSDSVSVAVDDLGTNKPETVSEDAGSDVYSYQQIDVEGVEDEDITESNVRFKVQKRYLDERDRSPEDVVMKRYNDQNWQELDTRIDEELDNSYRFEGSSTGFSYYAIALQEQENETQGEPNIHTSLLNVQPSEGTPPFDVTIDVTVENTGGAEGSQEVEVTLGDGVIKSETVSLGAGEERTLSYNYTVERSGSLSFSAGNQSTTVESSQKGTSMLPVAVTLLIVAILGAVVYTQRETIQDRVEDFRE
ncbi:MAG: PGF-pre-PGF domain-containing protein [Nanohaloarchaea archaeon]|nr:PGF-pre-PGF domain-containing protein [Candidatus Nanohaloarchaea archaeon]